MSKLPQAHQFLDLSDYGRPIARLIAGSLKNTSVTPVQVTIWFVISGLISIAFMVQGYYWLAGFFLVLKSILDAVDGELARIKGTPSYTGRYLDSVSDIILNFIIFIVIWYITEISIWWTFLAFFCYQLQGTLYNYYYVILRSKLNGDTTSRIIEEGTPTALGAESQKAVNILFTLYTLCYSVYDKIIYQFDKDAAEGKIIPNSLMTAVSTFGLGFQLLLISVFLIVGWKAYIIPFFIGYSIMIFIFIRLRKAL
ncbi:CDP-alcohol phosphatidyltransferase family protein [Vicingaceae bacterium]|nr:CDP-alcohol phosphatidyltransferase family protein [Vicingaceae bacterium]